MNSIIFYLFSEILNGDTCQESNQCSHMLTGSGCNGICQCAEGYTYIRGRCKKLVNLGSPCVEVYGIYYIMYLTLNYFVYNIIHIYEYIIYEI